MSILAESKDAYSKILSLIYSFIYSKGTVSFNDLLEWAEKHGIGSLTLSIVLNDLIEAGKLSVEEGFHQPQNIMVAFPVPKRISAVKIKRNYSVERKETYKNKDRTHQVEHEKSDSKVEGLNDDLLKAVEYLNNYWSVGIIRFINDLKLIGVSEPERILRRLLELGFVEYSPVGVLNATDRLPKVKRRRKLSDFI